MEKKVGIYLFIVFVVIFVTLSGYIFFTNNSDLENRLTNHTRNTQKNIENITTLNRAITYKKDSIEVLLKDVAIYQQLRKNDSVMIRLKNAKITKLLHENDSLKRIKHH